MTVAAATGGVLPQGFDDLERFVASFALPTEHERYRHRLSLTLPELRVFCDAVLPRMTAVMGYLVAFPADDVSALAPATRNLYHLAQSYFEVSHPIELKWRGVDLDDAFPEGRIIYWGPSAAEN